MNVTPLNFFLTASCTCGGGTGEGFPTCVSIDDGFECLCDPGQMCEGGICTNNNSDVLNETQRCEGKVATL